MDVTREDLRLGGAGNVVNNLTALGCQVSICSVIGADENGTVLQHVFTGKGVDVSGVFEDPLRTTSKKTRVVAANQQIVRIDRESKEPLNAAYEDRVIQYVERHGPEFQVLLISDYLKGVLTDKVLQSVIAFYC